ncbi:hypothetical protein MTO96_038316, partial [Rhipicephalus appendiculatus]
KKQVNGKDKHAVCIFGKSASITKTP